MWEMLQLYLISIFMHLTSTTFLLPFYGSRLVKWKFMYVEESSCISSLFLSFLFCANNFTQKKKAETSIHIWFHYASMWIPHKLYWCNVSIGPHLINWLKEELFRNWNEFIHCMNYIWIYRYLIIILKPKGYRFSK